MVIADVVIGAALVAAVSCAVVRIVQQHKAGDCSCGCSASSCSNCGKGKMH